ncbi:MAG: DUF411 domain-containing protein [Acidobacteriota bacterium]|nr:DUF411 domain-containing protein [Acidobacteriota bacterium]
MTISFRMVTHLMLAGTLAVLGPSGLGAQSAPEVAVFKSATCGCCVKWVDHLKANGFATTSTNVEDMGVVKAKHSVPRSVHSCHTALVGGYVIEGHVPASDIKRLLKEKPAISGIGVAGMPAGSPGMESATPQRYDVLSFDKQGQTRVYSTHGN